MTTTAQRFTYCISWLVPGLLFALAGISKIVSPAGATPEAAASFTAFYPTALRLLGVIELGAAVLLFTPRFRLAGRGIALVMVAGFSVFIALNAHDSRFLENCGCFGGLSVPGLGHSVAYLLLRNATLCGILALGIQGARATSENLLPSLAKALSAAGIVMLGSLYLGERTLRQEDHRVFRAAWEGQTQFRRPGRRLPDIQVFAADGWETSFGRELRANDHLVFFSPCCPHCSRMAPQWERFGRSAEENDARLVLVAIDEGEAVPEFKVRHGCPSLTHFVVRDRLDVLRLGVTAVPRMMVLDENRRVLFNKTQELAEVTRAPSSRHRRSGGLDMDLWNRIARDVFGEDASGETYSQPAPGVAVGPVKLSDGDTARLALLNAAEGPTYHLELAVGMDENNTVQTITAVTVGRYAGIFDPDLRLLDVLRGNTVGDAAAIARRLSAEQTLEAPIWRSVAELLTSLSRTMNVVT